MGIFVYCTPEEKQLIDTARRSKRMTLSGYVLDATLRQAEADCARARRRERS